MRSPRGNGEAPSTASLPAWIALHTSAQGAYFVDDLAELVVLGLDALGIEVTRHDENDAFPAGADWHVVVAPHEFFYLGQGAALRSRGLPERMVLLNTEARGTSWFAQAEAFFPRARMVWDIDYESAIQIADSGIPADYLCLGYASQASLGAEVLELPEVYWTRSLPREVRRTSFLHRALEERPLDVFFAGQMSPRREAFFAAHARAFAPLRCHFYFGSGPARATPEPEASMRGAVVRGLAQRSKVMLNVHVGEEMYFQWHRIVLQGIWNRALVVSEPCAFNPCFEPGRHYVEARPDDMDAALSFFLCDVEGRRRAAAIVDDAFATFVERCGVADALRRCLGRMTDVRP